MTPVSHQTIKLSRGKHAGPQEGACVMELASMLAGEPFSDHPVSVCPVIGSFLRAYNDCIDDTRRQDLYAYAAKVVGSRSTPEVERARAARLTSWSRGGNGRRRLWPVPRLHVIGHIWGPSPDLIALQVVHSISKRCAEKHREVLALVEELLAIGRPGESPSTIEDAPARSPAVV